MRAGSNQQQKSSSRAQAGQTKAARRRVRPREFDREAALARARSPRTHDRASRACVSALPSPVSGVSTRARGASTSASGVSWPVRGASGPACGPHFRFSLTAGVARAPTLLASPPNQHGEPPQRRGPRHKSRPPPSSGGVGLRRSRRSRPMRRGDSNGGPRRRLPPFPEQWCPSPIAPRGRGCWPPSARAVHAGEAQP